MKQAFIIPTSLLAVYWLANLYLHPQFVVGPDEPGYFDPAASWHLGQGFTSGAWYAQTDNEFFAGNLPLHHIAAKYWFDLLGFSPLSSRSFNWALISIAVFLYWWSLKRLQWLSTLWLSIVVAVALLSEGTLYASLSGRPDAITILLSTFTLFAFTLQKGPIAGSLLFLSGLLTALAGLQLAAASAFVLAVAFIFTKRATFKQTACFAIGGATGVLALVIFYDLNDVLPAFFASILPNTTAGNASIYTYTGFWLDRSLLIIWLCGLAMLIFAFFNRKTHPAQFHCSLAVAFILFGLPLYLLLLGKFSSSYTWMPIWAGLPAFGLWAMRIRHMPSGRVLSLILAIFLCSSAILGGYPRIVFKHLFDPQPSSFQVIDATAERYIAPDDVVLYSSSAFYAVKPRAARCFYINWYPNVMTENDANAITVVVLDEQRALHFIKEHPQDNWQPIGDPIEVRVGRFLRSPLIHKLQFYRKSNTDN